MICHVSLVLCHFKFYWFTIILILKLFFGIKFIFLMAYKSIIWLCIQKDIKILSILFKTCKLVYFFLSWLMSHLLKIVFSYVSLFLLIWLCAYEILLTYVELLVVLPAYSLSHSTYNMIVSLIVVRFCCARYVFEWMS